jgi:hypothetical protein
MSGRESIEGRSSTRGGDSAAALVLYSVYIINKAGGLIYQKDFTPVPKLATNDYLRLAGTFHSLHAITARGIPVVPLNDKKAAAQAGMQDALPKPLEGIQSLEAKVRQR